MKSKHTPGPWEYAPTAGHETHGQSVVYNDGLSIAIVYDGEANARLIAAAPDLLQACKAAVVSLIEDEHYQEFKNLISTLDKAIAEAEG